MPDQRPSSEGPAVAARRLLEYLAEGLVDEPEEVSVEQFEGDDGTIAHPLEADDRSFVGARPAHDPGRPSGHRHTRPRGQQARERPGHVEASVEPVRATDPAHLQVRRSVAHRR